MMLLKVSQITLTSPTFFTTTLLIFKKKCKCNVFKLKEYARVNHCNTLWGPYSNTLAQPKYDD